MKPHATIESVPWAYATEGAMFLVFRPDDVLPPAHPCFGKVLKIAKVDLVPQRLRYDHLHCSELETVTAACESPIEVKSEEINFARTQLRYAQDLVTAAFGDASLLPSSDYIEVRRKFALDLAVRAFAARKKDKLHVWDDPAFLENQAQQYGDDDMIGCILESDLLLACHRHTGSAPDAQAEAEAEAGAEVGLIAFEIKPKWGFLPDPELCNALSLEGSEFDAHSRLSSFACGMTGCTCTSDFTGSELKTDESTAKRNSHSSKTIRSQVCRFCMHQVYKRKKNETKDGTDGSNSPLDRRWFCPLDLYSSEPTRLAQAVEGLFASPGNNLQVTYSKIASDGRLIITPISGEDSSELPHYNLFSLLLNVLHDPKLRATLATIKELQEAGDPLTPIGASAVSLELRRRIEFLPTCDCQHCSTDEIRRILSLSEAHSGVLSRPGGEVWEHSDVVDSIQKLWLQSTGQSSGTDPSCADRKLRDAALTKTQDIVTPAVENVHSFTSLIREQLQHVPTCALIRMIRGFLISATLKDLSLFALVPIQGIHSGGTSNLDSNVVLPVRVYLIDIQQKAASKLESYAKLDENIVATYKSFIGSIYPQ